VGWRIIGKWKKVGLPKDIVPKVVRLIRSSESDDSNVSSHAYASRDQDHPRTFDLRGHSLLSQRMNETETFDAVGSSRTIGRGERRRAWTYKSI